jgi:lipopolysaccharide transport system permease protein
MSISPATDVAAPDDADADAAPDDPTAAAAAAAAADAAATAAVGAGAPDQQVDEAPELIIRARKGWIAIDWNELWRYRELLYFLVWRDVKVRYKQAILGFAWAVFAPLISVAIFTLIFGRAGGFKKDLPAYLQDSYSLFVFAGLIPWQMISSAISGGGMSLVNQQNLLSKIYMPRLFIPTAVIGSSLVDMGISWVVFFGMMLLYGITPAWTIVFIPPLIVLTMMAGMAMSYTLSALTVTYRDLRFLIPFMVQLLMLISAVAYPSSVLRAYPWLLYVNPFAGIIGAYRAAMFREVYWQPWHLLLSVVMISGLLVFGLFYFRKTERRFADIA